jgi:hypothetical protein
VATPDDTLLICWSCLIQVSCGVLVRADRLPVASAQNVEKELSCLGARPGQPACTLMCEDAQCVLVGCIGNGSGQAIHVVG